MRYEINVYRLSLLPDKDAEKVASKIVEHFHLAADVGRANVYVHADNYLVELGDALILQAPLEQIQFYEDILGLADCKVEE